MLCPALRTELGAAFHLRAALRAEFLALDGLAALAAELGVRRDACPAIRARPDNSLIKFFFGHICGFLRHLPCLLNGGLGLRCRVFCFEVRGTIEA